MALKRKLTAAPTAAEAALYKKVEGKEEWTLDLEGDDTPAPNVDEFRNKNIALLKEKADLEKKLADAEKAAASVAPKDEENKTLAQQVKELQTRWDTSQKATLEAEKRVRDEQWRNSVITTATKHKIRDDAAARALHTLADQTFREKDGKRQPLDADGNVIYSKKNAASLTPLSLEEWVEERKTTDYKDFFSQPQGGGGRGSNGAPDTSGFMRLTSKQAAAPNAEQLKAMAEKKAVIED